MGILSALIGQVSNFGLNYLNDYLVQKRLEDSMRQSTNYLTGTAIPEAQKATGFQEAMLEGQAPPGAASLLGFTAPPTVREPYGPQAQKLAEAVQYTPQIPEGMPVTPQLQAQVMNIAGTVAGQPRAMVGQMQKGQEERARIVNQRITQAHTILDPFIQYMDPNVTSRNIDLYSKTGAIPTLFLDVPKDIQQQAIKLAGQKSQAIGYGGAAGRGAYEAGPGMDILRQQEQIRGEARVKYREGAGEPKPKDIPSNIRQEVIDNLASKRPDMFDDDVDMKSNPIKVPKPEIQPVINAAVKNFKKQGQRDVDGAVDDALQSTPRNAPAPAARQAIPVPKEQRGRFREGAGYNYKGGKYIYRNGVMVPTQ